MHGMQNHFDLTALIRKYVGLIKINTIRSKKVETIFIHMELININSFKTFYRFH